jgi:circadian clock protein KaiA
MGLNFKKGTMTFSAIAIARPQISIFALLGSEVLIAPLQEILERNHYTVACSRQPEDFFAALDQDGFSIDCLILEQQPDFMKVVRRLHREATLLPAVIVVDSFSLDDEATLLSKPNLDTIWYHTAEVRLDQTNLAYLPQRVDNAIANFLKLSAKSRFPHPADLENNVSVAKLKDSLTTQQQRLSDKLKERLGYMGIYYKRDAQLFFRNLPQEEQETFLEELRSEYRDIILSYFREENDINHHIDAFVNKVFFADMSVSQVLEIHMELMDHLAKRLKLEGRSEDILLDYRLTLIDAIAHLCEMYRRSIPREP